MRDTRHRTLRIRLYIVDANPAHLEGVCGKHGLCWAGTIFCLCLRTRLGSSSQRGNHFGFFHRSIDKSSRLSCGLWSGRQSSSADGTDKIHALFVFLTFNSLILTCLSFPFPPIFIALRTDIFFHCKANPCVSHLGGMVRQMPSFILLHLSTICTSLPRPRTQNERDFVEWDLEICKTNKVNIRVIDVFSKQQKV